MCRCSQALYSRKQRFVRSGCCKFLKQLSRDPEYSARRRGLRPRIRMAVGGRRGCDQRRTRRGPWVSGLPGCGRNHPDRLSGKACRPTFRRSSQKITHWTAMMLRIRLASNHLSIAAACTIVFGSLLRANARGSVGALWAGATRQPHSSFQGPTFTTKSTRSGCWIQYNPHCRHRSGVVLDF